MTIRELAKAKGVKVIGKLHRHAEYEYDTDDYGNKWKRNFKFYADDGQNEYYLYKNDVCIVTADGNVI